MAFFNPSALERAQRAMDHARRSLIDAQNSCTLARAALEDAGRQSEAVAINMVCASVKQSEADLIRWKEMTAKTRENSS